MLKKIKTLIKKIIGVPNKNAKSFWKNYKPDLTKSHQEIACYSHTKDVQECIDKTHILLIDTFNKYLRQDESRVLDIGCGPGLYLKDFSPQHKLWGLDINKNMLTIAKQNVPQAKLIQGDFLEYQFNTKFDFIYSVGVVQYVKPDEIIFFFNKAADLLDNRGFIFISYPHALSEDDIIHPDKNFVQYSPNYLNEIISSKFILIQNKHIFDDRVIKDYDRSPYKPLNPSFDKTYKNSSILIAQRL